MAVSFRPEDREFVEVAIDQLRSLGLEKYSPHVLIWTKNLPAYQCFLHKGYLLLPQSMVGKLQPEDWRSIVASEAIFRELSKRKRGTLVGMFILAIPLIFVILIGSVVVINRIGENLGIGPVGDLPRTLETLVNLGLTAIPIFIGTVIMQSHGRRLRLEADQVTSASPGGETLLQSLVKIQGFQAGIHTGRLRLLLLLSRFPTLSRRIGDLQKKSAPPKS